MPIDNLTLRLTATYQDFETKSYEVPQLLAAFFPQSEIPLLYTAEKSATFGVRYELPVSDALGDISLNANFYYTDEVQMVSYTANSYTLTNLRADWNYVMGSSFDVGLFVRNAFDEEAVVGPAALSSASPIGTAIYNEPRMFGAEVRYRFGTE